MQPQSSTRQTFVEDYFYNNAAHEGEGCHTTASVAGADHFTANLLRQLAKSGQPPPEDLGPQQREPTTRRSPVQKRSFKRACRRMMAHGYAWYHGRMMTSQDFPQALQHSLQQEKRPGTTCANHLQGDRNRLRVLQWNPGGINQGVFQEFKYWLRNQPIDIVVICETKWSFSSCWSDDRWSYVHSTTDEHRSGGVLVMIARKWAGPDQIGFHEELPGRILHVRLHFGTRSTDVVAVYQHADYRDKTSYDRRQKFWTHLDQYLHRLPNRNQLICSGDFYCALQMQLPWSGTHGFRWQGRRHQGYQHRDHHRFQNLLADHHLVALNTWDESKGPTYYHGEYAARIDFICTRIHACDGKSKDVAYLNTAEFVPLNASHHIPLLASIRKLPVQYHVTRVPKACNLDQRARCRQAQLQDLPQWHDLTERVCAAVTHLTATASSSADLFRNLHDQVIPAFQEIFVPVSHRPQTPDYTECQHTIRTKWTHHRTIIQLRHHHSTDAFTMFQVWKHWSAFRRLQRVQQRQARQAKTRRFHDMCQELQHAANHHDAHGMFKIINQHTPKKSTSRIRLRTSDGQIADQYATHAMLVEYVQRTWQGPRSLPKFYEGAPGVPFDADQIRRAVLQLHPNKSVAMPFLPAIVWKGASDQIATFIHDTLRVWWGQYPPIIPQDWKDAWLYFIPKPGKPCNCPANLRPISLMETFGKLVMGLIADQLKMHLEQALCALPQLGFLPLRGSLDAIRRVSQHCNLIRVLINANRRTVARQMIMPPRHTVVGGVQMFLDLTRAFDCVDRAILVDHLHELHTPHALLTIITHWHEGTRYHIVSPHNRNSCGCWFRPTPGMQDCPIVVAGLHEQTAPHPGTLTGETWIRECMTLYADDVHVGCQFSTIQELDHHLQCMGHLLDCIERLKLTLSYQKTFVILAATGSNMKRVLSRAESSVLHRLCWLVIPRGDGSKTELPMRSAVTYLGTTMSYGAYELQTWKQRKRAGWAAFSRLKCWLQHRQISLAQRLYLWRTCVQTIITYGITATNVTVQVLNEYQTITYQMLRTIFGNHPYRTRATHSQVLDMYNHPHPLDLLCCLVTSLWQRIQRRQLVLDHNDFLQNITWNHLPDLLLIS